MEKTLALVIDDQESIRKTFRFFLEEEGYEVATAGTYEDGMAVIAERTPSVALIDIILGSRSGVDFLREIKHFEMEFPVVMITGEPNLETATDALRLGAFDYLAKPVDKRKLLDVTYRATRYNELLAERRRAQEDREHARQQLLAVFNGVGEGLILINGEGRVREINQATLQLLGFPRDEAIDRPLEQLFPRVADVMNDGLQDVLKRNKQQAEATVDDPFRRGGKEVFHAKISPSAERAGQRGAVVVLRDITRLRALEQHVSERTRVHNLIGKSKPMQEIYHLVEVLRDTDTTVLIQGESGTGKELVAAALHYQGPRARGPFIPVNCTALNEQLLESELFGHAKGSFTGAIANKIGRFEAAEGGTIFLDEIGDVSSKLQTKLLRALQERTVERVGESRPRKVDVRVVAATNVDLDAKVKEGAFREDLFYRLNVVRVMMPALRDKKEDIPLLAEHFRQKLLTRLTKPIEGYTDEAFRLMLIHEWPGNVRELENAVEHAFIMSNGPLIDAVHLPKTVREPSDLLNAGRGAGGMSEREQILEALVKSAGNRSKAANMLGINRTTLYRRMQRWNIADPTRL